MGQFSMVVAIVFIVMVATVMKARYRAMARLGGDHNGGAPHLQSADAMRAQEEIRALKDRVAVLERLGTDHHGTADLERQIEQLRNH